KRGGIPRLIAEDGAARSGLEPGLDGLILSEAVNQVVGQGDVARALKLERALGCRLVGKDAIGIDPVAEGARALDVDARPVVEDDQVALRGGPTHEAVVGAVADLNAEAIR